MLTKLINWVQNLKRKTGVNMIKADNSYKTLITSLQSENKCNLLDAIFL